MRSVCRRYISFLLLLILLIADIGGNNVIKLRAEEAGSVPGTSSNSVSEDTVSEDSISDNTTSENVADLNIYHRTQAEISDFIKSHPAAYIKAADAYDTKPSLTSPYASGTLKKKAEEAAYNAINQARFAAGLDADVTKNLTYTSKAQAGALVNAVNKSLKRPPARPDGMGDEMYKLAQDGVNASLLAGDCDSLARAILEVWIPDKKNESSLGLRRWALNPEMLATGFGQVEKYEAMYIFDRGRKTGTRTVAWPAENMPLDWMNDNMCWSVNFGWKLDESRIEVELMREKDKKTWTFSKKKADGVFHVNNGNYGQQGCVIFKPSGFKKEAGDRYRVRVSGASELTLEYNVEFFIPGLEVKLSNTNVLMPPGAEYQLKATITPSSAPQTVVWSVEKGDAVSVDAKGNIKAEKLGTAVVRATSTASTGMYAECSVTVEEENLTPPYIYSPAGLNPEPGDVIVISAALPEEGLKLMYAVDDDEYREYYKPITVEESMVGKDICVKAFISANQAAKHKSSKISAQTFHVMEADVRGDITDEDWASISINGVPDGIWVRGLQPSYEYTGKKIKPADLRVYYRNILLGKADRSIKYINNRDAGTATVKISLKGNFKNDAARPLTYSFKIEPIDIGGDDFSAEDICLSVLKDRDGMPKLQKVSLKILRNGKNFPLKNVDVLCYPIDDTERKRPVRSVMNEGDYTVVIRGKKNYTGERVIKLHVDSRICLNGMKATGYARKLKLDPSKKGQEPDLSKLKLKRKDAKLTYDDLSRFDVSVSDNECTGKAYVLISARPGDKEYAGSLKLPFTITGYSVKASTVSFPKENYYRGSETVFSETELSVVSRLTGRRLEAGKDMTVSYEKNTDAGTARLIISGKGMYSGTLKKSFKIKRCNIDEFRDRIKADIPDSLRFSKNGNVMKKRSISLNDTVTGKKLVEGKDYTLKYYNNKSANGSKTPYIKISGKGNYSGVRKKYFTITAPDIRETSMIAGNIVWKDKAGVYKSPYALFDVDGGKLKSGKDYNKAVYKYAYFTTVRDSLTGEKRARTAGETIQPGDILPLGSVVRLEVSGKGNYAGKDADGKVLKQNCEYTLVKDDIKGFDFRVDSYEYTGRGITPRPVEYAGKEKGIHASYFPAGVREDAIGKYRVLYYSANVKKGTARIIVTGNGSYGGTRTIKFRIGRRYGRAAEGE
ncbi:MAG: Ig-like domain-containing protein [Lachnospiraceae bacterium]|nr:Ig-like domain-containing protein [Lachnospiraceae bacterium]